MLKVCEAVVTPATDKGRFRNPHALLSPNRLEHLTKGRNKGKNEEMKEEITHIASCSFGKDSIATILLALEHNEPLDRIVTVEVMFDHSRGISGEDPDHVQWMKDIAIPRLKELTGIDTDIVRNEKVDYLTLFYKKRINSKLHPERNGKYQGFLGAGFCQANCECKMKPLRRYFRQFDNCVQYVGIAIDEPTRLERIDGVHKVSLLAKYGYTERMAYDLCAKYDLLSPTYKTLSRGGCWFCPNKGVKGFCCIRNHHPQLWDELRELSKETNTISPYFDRDKTFAQLEHRMDNFERQLTLF